MIKAHLFISKDGMYTAEGMDAGADIHGYSLKKRSNDEQVLLRDPQGAGLETFYTSLLILKREQSLASINASLTRM